MKDHSGWYAVAVIALGTGWLVSCDAPEPKKKPAQEPSAIWVDPETNCQYLIFRSGTYGAISVTPKLRPDGVPHCFPDPEVGQ
jgi:hypothetical protein